MLLLVALGVELLEVGPQVRALLLVLDAGEHHLGPRNLGAWIGDVFGERLVVPGDAGVLVRFGVIVTLDGAGLAPIEPVEHRADLVLGVRTNRVAGQALLERGFAGAKILRERARRSTDQPTRDAHDSHHAVLYLLSRHAIRDASTWRCP